MSKTIPPPQYHQRRRKTMKKTKIPSKLWKALVDNFDLKTMFTLHERVSTLMMLRYTPELTLKEHLSNFAAQWSTILERTLFPTGRKEGFGFHMHQIANDAKCKDPFLLLSIRHSSMERIVDNFQTKEDLIYKLAHHQLLAIA